MYLTSDLITAVKRRAAMPTAQNTFATADFLELADEETRSKMLPLILKNIEDFYTRTADLDITADQSGYLIPTRAVAAALRDVQIVSSANDENRTPLERLSPEDLYASSVGSPQIAIKKNGFYLQGNKVVIYPTPKHTQDILRLSYYCRPNSLVDVSECARVTAIDTTLKQITVDSAPATFSTSSPLDFVKANPHFECSAIDQTPSNVAGNVLTFTDSLPDDVAVGDYICLAGESCVVQVPAELQPLLVQYVVIRVLSAQSDTEALKAALAELKTLEENAQLLIAPRVIGKAKRVVNSRPIGRWV